MTSTLHTPLSIPDILATLASFVWMSATGNASATELGLGAAAAAAAITARSGLGLVGSWLAGLGSAAATNRLGQYTLCEMIGQGGMGEVYRGRHAMMDRDVAIKLLPRDHADAESRARFEREALLTSRLSSPNTVRVHDYGQTPDGRAYYVMEHVEGANLEDFVAKHGPLGPGRAIHLLRQVASALGEAHAAGLVHRDVKPANLALCERAGVKDVVKVLDFGLARATATGDAPSEDGRLIGTPAYLAPEAILTPDAVDSRADVYALGAVAYWLLTGTPVFDGNSIVEICSHHLHAAPDTLTERLGDAMPADLEEVVLRCLAKDPENRYASMIDLTAALDACVAADDWSAEVAEEWWRTATEPAAPIGPATVTPTGSAKLRLAEIATAPDWLVFA